MILRSRRTRRPSTEASTPKTTRRSLRSRSAIRTRAAWREEAVIECSVQFSEEESVPVVAKRPKIQPRPRRRKDSGDADFITPVRGRQPRVHFREDCDTSSPNPAVRNIYSPVLPFLTPTKADAKSPRCKLGSRPRVPDYDSIGSADSAVTPRATRRSLRPHSAVRTRAASREEAVTECALRSAKKNSSPKNVRASRERTRARCKSVSSVDSRDVDFKTPVRSRQSKVHFQEGRDALSPNPTVRNIYSPIVRFLTPVKAGLKSPGCKMMSPELCLFGFDSLGPLHDEETNDEPFNPYTFIKNIPSQSQQSKPCVRDIPIKTRSTPEATLVLDLDETLVFSTLSVIDKADCTFDASFQGDTYKVYMVLRPHVCQFLQRMSKVFEMFVYTTAKREYADKILDVLDPQKKLFRHRLYQEDCFCILGHYVKDLGLLQRDLAKTAVLDKAPHSFPYHVMNMVPVQSWVGDKADSELLKLIPYLEKLSEAEDFRHVLKRRADHLHRLLSED
ncbi:hypothetical protein AGOR_G00237130 [Albula goreensis]|uniref:FCP1 homology domain-containing protein n=1 Tax=Albula goreensis TaxID=1534307 RepID=A0A8T3CCY8_9TELE|nr:hypothetical protein AGOR_G00237130 [Albula goreensis]